MNYLTFSNSLNDFNRAFDFSFSKVDYFLDEDQNAFYLLVEMPGVSKENLEISFENQYLTIKAKAKIGKNNKKIEKAFTLPENTDKETIEAALKDGILTITMHKNQNKVKNIPIK